MKARLSEDRTYEILRSHLIDPEPLQRDDWEEFFLARREELKTLIHANCGGQMQEFSDGLRVSLPAQLLRLSDDVSGIELRLRGLIGGSVAEWNMIPSSIRDRADERIELEIRSNPGTDRSQFDSVQKRLAFCDLRGLEQIIVNASLWPHFADAFGTKENVAYRFRQLATFRNADAHLRAIDDVVRSDAEAAVLWFRNALTRIESTSDLQLTEIPAFEDLSEEESEDSDFQEMPSE